MTYWLFSSSAIFAVAAASSSVFCTTTVWPPLWLVISLSAAGLTRGLIGWDSANRLPPRDERVASQERRAHVGDVASLAVSAPSETTTIAARGGCAGRSSAAS